MGDLTFWMNLVREKKVTRGIKYCLKYIKVTRVHDCDIKLNLSTKLYREMETDA